MTLSLVILGFIFILGLIVGSFMNVVILRTVSEESIVFPGSKCPKCQTPLKWYHNIPVLSYIFLRGKCGFCGEKISIQYPLVELLTGVLFILLFLRFCMPFDPLFGLSVINPITWPQVIIYIFSIIVTCLFIAIAGTDFIEKKVSDAHTLPLIGMGILYSITYSVVNIIAYTRDNGFPKIDLNFIFTCPVIQCLAVAILGFLIMEAISRLSLLLIGTRAFGEGDSYIAAGLGSVFGAIFGSSALYTDFAQIFRSFFAILIFAAVIQVLITLPILMKKFVQSKNWVTLGALSAFILYSIGYMFAQYAGWLTNKFAYWSSTIVLLAIGLFTCGEILLSIKETKGEGGLYLPFGPAMIISGLIALLILGF